MKITLSVSKVCGMRSNKCYPDKKAINNAEEMAKAISFDHVCGEFKNNRRSKENFISSDCIVMDCDNDHSEKKPDWIRPEDVTTVLSDVSCIIVTSRNNMKQKGDKAARPRFHVYFPIEDVTEEAECVALKHRVQAAFPFFDKNALDSARFIFGNEDVEAAGIIWNEGNLTITDYLFFFGEESGEDNAMEDSTGDNGHTGHAENAESRGRAIPEGRRNGSLSVTAGKILKRFGNTPEAHEAFRLECEKCDPPMGKAELRNIWRSALKFYKVVKNSPDYVAPADYNAPEWTEPIPFDKCSVFQFPVDALPDTLSKYVSEVAESTQTPVDMAGTVAISILSACLQGKYRIQGKADWIEPLNTYALVIAAPSERKSAVTHMMVKPLNDYEVKYNREHASNFEMSRMAKKVLERRQKTLIEEFSKGKATQDDMDKMAQQIADFKEETPLQLYVDDITPEKLVSVLSANKGRVAMISTEGGIFDTLAGAYSKVVNIDVMLKGYSGDTIRVDRVGRNSEYVTDPALTILLMAQPNVVSAVLDNSTFRGRGLTARFLYCLPESRVGERKYHSKSVDEDARTAYEELIKSLLEDSSTDELITLSGEADSLIASYAEELEPLLITKYAEFSDWCGKLIGNTLRIAGLLCRAGSMRVTDENSMGCFDDVSTVNDPLVVGGKTMENAIRISRYYLSHAQAAYSALPANTLSTQAEKILAVIREKKLVDFDRREMMRMCRSFKTVAEIQPVLDDLEDYGYIARQPEKPSNTGRPPLPRYLVNPLMLKGLGTEVQEVRTA